MPRISDLPPDSAPDGADIVPFVDVSAVRTKAVTVADLAASEAFAGRYFPRSGNTAVSIGDSLMAGSTDGPWWPLAAQLSGGRFLPALNGGVGGETSTAQLARIDDVLAVPANWCFVASIGPNDPIAGISVATSIANVKAIVAACAAANVRPIIVLGPPNDTTATRDHILNVNGAISYWASQNGYWCIDPMSAVADTDGTFTSAGTFDGAHLSAAGIRLVADACVAALPPEMQRAPRTLAVSNNDPLNKISNALFTTDTGGVGTGWTKSGTATTTISAVGAGHGVGNWQNIAPSDTTTTSLYRDIATVIGQRYEFAVRVKAATSTHYVRLSGSPGSTDLPALLKAYGDIAEADGAVIVWQFAATVTSTRVFLGAGSAAGTVSYAQPTFRDLTAIEAL